MTRGMPVLRKLTNPNLNTRQRRCQDCFHAAPSPASAPTTTLVAHTTHDHQPATEMSGRRGRRPARWPRHTAHWRARRRQAAGPSATAVPTIVCSTPSTTNGPRIADGRHADEKQDVHLLAPRQIGQPQHARDGDDGREDEHEGDDHAGAARRLQPVDQPVEHLTVVAHVLDQPRRRQRRGESARRGLAAALRAAAPRTPPAAGSARACRPARPAPAARGGSARARSPHRRTSTTTRRGSRQSRCATRCRSAPTRPVAGRSSAPRSSTAARRCAAR